MDRRGGPAGVESVLVVARGWKWWAAVGMGLGGGTKGLGVSLGA